MNNYTSCPKCNTLISADTFLEIDSCPNCGKSFKYLGPIMYLVYITILVIVFWFGAYKFRAEEPKGLEFAKALAISLVPTIIFMYFILKLLFKYIQKNRRYRNNVFFICLLSIWSLISYLLLHFLNL